MFIFRMKSLAAKLILITGCAIALVLLISNFFLIGETRNRVETLTMDQANLEAKAIANEVASSVGELAGAARSMAGVIGRGHEGKYLDRKSIVDMLKANVERNQFAFGSWFGEEPNAFDGQSPSFAGRTDLGSDKTGAFNAYWTKTKDGGYTFSVFGSDYKAEWYSLAAASKKGAISSPYAESTTGENTAMTSIAYPVMSAGKMIGVSGVDISLKSLTDKLGNLHPFGTGRVTLLSQGGNWIVAPSKDLAMKPYEGEGVDKVKAGLSTLSPAVVKNLSIGDGEPFDRVVYPFALPDLNTNWVILVDVPHSAINAPVQDQTVMMIVAGVLVLAAVMLALYFAVRAFVQKPLGGLVASVRTLSEGRYEQPVTGQDRADETGSVAKALEGFRHALADSRRLEAEAKVQRQEAESERGRSESERQQSVSLQRHIVSIVGSGLSELSKGNLSHRINDEFPGEYDKLKQDFNAALAALEETITTMNLSVVNIGSHHRRHRRDRLPDQPAGAQRRRRGCPCRRSRQGLCRRRPGSARTRPALGQGRQGDQDADHTSASRSRKASSWCGDRRGALRRSKAGQCASTTTSIRSPRRPATGDRPQGSQPAVNQMDQVTQQNAAMVEETTAASSSLRKA
jgi:methyl-accepting chemotaxis protein